MIKSIDTINKKIKISFNRKNHEKIAAYLYRRDKCVEKVMYVDQDSIEFDHVVDNSIYHIVGYIRDVNHHEVTVEVSNYFLPLNEGYREIYSKVLLESPNVLITSYDQGSDITFITFNGTRTTKKTKSFGLNFVLEQGWNCICVHQDNDSQYQDLSLELFYEAVKDYIIDQKVFTYGVSLGGYCAIYYGGIINAKIIVGSPKNSAHPEYLHERFEKLSFRHKNIIETPKSQQELVILYDPFQLEDVKFIGNEILPHYSEAILIPLLKAGHRVFEPLARKRLLKNYIRLLVSSSDIFFVNNSLLREYFSNND